MIETEFYILLFDAFLKTNNDDKEKIMWKLNSIVKLMQLSNNSDNDLFCENGLRMIMTLFNNYLLDSYDIESNNFNSSSAQEREIGIQILKNEFI